MAPDMQKHTLPMLLFIAAPERAVTECRPSIFCRGSMQEEKILIVDDDDSHRFMLKCILGSWGYGICEADDGESALQMIDKAGVSLILMDYRMKKVSGLEVMAEMSHRRCRIPVILMTAYCSSETASAAHRHGAAAVLDKPLPMGKLKNLISRTIAESLHSRF